MQIEYFEWQDSTNRAGWHAIEDVPELLDIPEITSVGYVVAEDADFVYLSTTVSENEALAPVRIPIADILYREVLFVTGSVEREGE